MGACRSLVVAVAAVTATVAVVSSVTAASVAPSDRTFVVVHKPAVVAPTRAPTPRPTPCLVKYDCSTTRTVAAQCPTVVRQPVACHGGGSHKWVAHKATCYADVTVSRPCHKTIKVARMCVKACATPVPTPCTRSVACNKVETFTVDCSTTKPVVVACPKTAEFFDAAGKPLAICQTMKKTAKTCTKSVVTPSKCVVPCATAKATRAPKAAVVQKKEVLGVPAKTWVNLVGKVVTAVVNKKGGVVVPTAAPTAAPTAVPSAAPSSPPTISAGNGGNGGNGGAGPDGGDGGVGGVGGDALIGASPAARFDY